MRILIVANDVVSKKMAGPGIRCFELGRQLRLAGHVVTIAGIEASDLDPGEATILPPLGAHEMAEVAASHDVVLLEGLALARYGVLRSVEIPVIVDLYDPFPLALLEQEALRPVGERRDGSRRIAAALNDLLTAGDFFLCASERQRDLWIGSLLAAGRVNADTWAADNSLRRLIDVVPFGISEEPIPARSAGSRAVMGSSIAKDDLVLLWGGGIYNWFDPLTLLKAVARAAVELPNLRLIFMSTTHPHRGVPSRMWMPSRTRELSDRLGLTGSHVIFHEEWVPYADRGLWLSAADCGVSTHFDHAETRFSFRTRILDYLWAGLPIICTEGDIFADMVRQEHLGWAVTPEDVSGLTAAILSLGTNSRERESMRANVRAVAEKMTWPIACRPLLRYCEDPERAPDFAGKGRRLTLSSQTVIGSPAGAWHTFRLGVRSLRTVGLRETVSRVSRWRALR